MDLLIPHIHTPKADTHRVFSHTRVHDQNGA